MQRNRFGSMVFIRYRDPEPHLRIRVELKEPDLFSKAFLFFSNSFELWMKKGWIKDVVLGNYERELERYGGKNLIDNAEAVFCSDSLYACYLIRASLNKKLEIDEFVLQILSMINFLKDFNLDEKMLQNLLTGINEDRSELRGFREVKNKLLPPLNDLFKKSSDKNYIEAAIIQEISQIRKDSAKSFVLASKKLDKENLLEIYSSLLHMHCNRLGCDVSSERKLRLYALHALKMNKRRNSFSIRAGRLGD